LVLTVLWVKGPAGTPEPSRDPEIAPHSEIAADLKRTPAVPDLEEQIERVLASDSSDKHASDDQETNRATEVIRGTRALGAWLSTTPEQVTFRKLVQHPDLNPSNAVLPTKELEAAEARLDSTFKRIRDLRRIEIATADAEMKLVAATRPELGSAVVEKKVGDRIEVSVSAQQMQSKSSIYSAHATHGRSFVFTLADLPQTYQVVQGREVLMAEALSAAIEFLCKNAVGNANSYLPIVESFYRHSLTLR